MLRYDVAFLFCFFLLHYCHFAKAEDKCDETCEQIKFDKVKTATADLRETCKEMEVKIDSLENMLELLEDERKWTLALKVDAGSHICVGCAWSNPAAVNPQSYLQAIDLKKPCGCAFVNHDVLANWSQLFQSNMTQVSVSFWNRSSSEVVRVTSALFDGRDSTKDSWFRQNRVRDSSFDDLGVADVKVRNDNFTLVVGQTISFSMSASDPLACDAPSSSSSSSSSPKSKTEAKGWMMVGEKRPPCLASDAASSLISGGRFPAFLYVEDVVAGAWKGARVRSADVMTIFVR